jgi:hypothetical protein
VLISLSYPIIDSRRFLSDAPDILGRPTWPNARADSDFIRGFGLVRRRRNGGLPAIGAATICGGSAALRFEALLPRSRKPNSQRPLPGLRCKSRHFWFDGLAVGSYDLMLGTTAPLRCENAKATYEFLTALLQIRVRVNGAQFIHLPSASASLAQLYQRASAHSAEMLVPGAVRGTPPVLILDLGPQDELVLGKGSREVMGGSPGFRLWKHYFKVRNGELALWVFKGESGDRRRIREVRIAITRLYAVYESVRVVAEMLTNRKIPLEHKKPANAALQEYLTQALKSIRRDERNVVRSEYDANDAVGYALRANLATDIGGLEDAVKLLEQARIRGSLLRGLSEFISQTKNNDVNFYVEKYVNTNIQGDGNAVAGGDVQGNTISVDKSASLQAIQGLDLGQLARQLADLKNKLKDGAKTPEQFASLAAVAEGEQSARDGNERGVVEALKKAGKWALDVATKIGVPIAVKAIVASLGIAV